MVASSLKDLFAQAQAHQTAGRMVEAVALYDQMLAAKPDLPEVLFHKGRCLAADNPKAAEAAFRKALKIRPGEAAIWQGLYSVLKAKAAQKLADTAARQGILIGSERDLAPAMQLMQSGKLAEAETAVMRVAKAAPLAFAPALLLGQIRLRRGQVGAALGPLNAAHDRDPTHREATILLARTLTQAGQVRRAETLLDELPKGRPSGARERAEVLRLTARPIEAMTVLSDALRSDPRNARLLGDLALSAGQAGDAETALSTLKRAAPLARDPIALIRQTAAALEEAGAFEAASTAIAFGRDTHPDRAVLLTHAAQLCQSSGDFGAADALLVQAIAADPNSGEAYRAYANGRKVAAEDAVMAKIDTVLARPNLGKIDRAGLHFAAAKAASDQGRTEAVFPHLTTANRLMSDTYPYAFAADLSQAQALLGHAETLSGLPPSGPDDPVIFVTGVPRSGTTLVETILAAHPETAAGGEMPFLSRALAPALDGLRDGSVSKADFATAGTRYLDLARRRVGQGVIIDKAISTFSRIGHTLAALPGARIVVVRRDPRDTGLSLYRNMFPEGLHRYAYDLTAMGRYIRLFEAVSEAWQLLHPDRVHVVEYEALTAQPETEVPALLAAVGLPWNDACLSPQSAGGRIQTLSFAQARQPIGTGSVAGWRRHEDDLADLIAALEEPVNLRARAKNS